MAGHVGKHSVLSTFVATNHLFTISKSISASVDLTRKEIETFNGFESVVARTQIMKALCSQRNKVSAAQSSNCVILKISLFYFIKRCKINAL